MVTRAPHLSTWFRWVPLGITLVAMGGLWMVVPEIRRLWTAGEPPWGIVLGFAGCYAIWTGLRGVRYWILLNRPEGQLLMVMAVAYVHHAAIDFMPFRSGVLAYPLLTRVLIQMRWRAILASMVGSALGDGLVTSWLLIWLLPPALQVALIVIGILVVWVGCRLRAWARFWFRLRHTHAGFLFRSGWWFVLGLSLLWSHRSRRDLLTWVGLSAAIVGIKYGSLTWLYTGWASAYGAQALPFGILFLALVASELSRELPVHGWLHLGTWEAVWLAVTQVSAQAPVVLWMHLSYEAVVLLLAIPAALFLLRSHRNEARQIPIGL